MCPILKSHAEAEVRCRDNMPIVLYRAQWNCPQFVDHCLSPSYKSTMASYNDKHISLDHCGLTIRKYYFPSGASKTIPIHLIQSVLVAPLGSLDRWRIWGAGDFGLTLRHWYNADMKRPTKHIALIVTMTGSKTHPVLTPDDPLDLMNALVTHGVPVIKSGESKRVMTRPNLNPTEDEAVLLPIHQEEINARHDEPFDEHSREGGCATG